MDITFVFFIYGLAFFCMGLAILLESGRVPLLAGARVFFPLAIFGFVHGSHEWLEMFLDKSEWLVFRYPDQMNWLRVSVLAISFTALIVFGLMMWQPQRQYTPGEATRRAGALLAYIMLVFLFGLSFRRTHLDWLGHLDAFIRYLIAVPGAILAGLALYRQASLAMRQGRSTLAPSLRVAGWGFFLYAATQAVVQPLDIFPANFVNTASFAAWLGFPVQFVRAIVAVMITIAMLRLIRLMEGERQRQFQAAQKARLDALQQVQRELEAREALRQDLLRHTVIAQEEERARIARELHDETSQVLTAFTLHLAALREIIGTDPRGEELIRELQVLSRHMSRGIYRLVRDLRPSILDDLGLVAALQFLADEEAKRFDLKVDLEIGGRRQRLDALVETVLFRVAQEALTNVFRHAEVPEAQIQLMFFPGMVTLRVCDRGVGFDPEMANTPSDGWGLAGMRERVDSVGGKLNFQSAPGQGTVVEVNVPLHAVQNNGEIALQAVSRSAGVKDAGKNLGGE